MILAKFLAKQLKKPTGFFGKYLLTRALNKANKVMNDAVLHLLQVMPDDHILEIGFGGGDLLTRIAGQLDGGVIRGVDFSFDMVEIGRKRFQSFIDAGKLELHCADADSLPFDASSFNKICTVNTIYFWPDVNKVLTNMMRVLESKGIVIVCFSTKKTMDSAGKITRYGFNKYSVDEVLQYLEKAGFINLRVVPGKNGHGDFVSIVAEKF